MRLYLVLILTAVSMAFVTGYFVLFFQGNVTVTSEDILRIQQIKNEFQRKEEPHLMINLTSLYYSREQLKLLSPVYTVPIGDSHADKVSYHTNEYCFSTLPFIVNADNFNKVTAWEEFRCDRRRSLPEEFFERPPYLHPSGQSFVYLAYLHGSPLYRSRTWLLNNLQHFHVTELRHVTEIATLLDGIYLVLANLSDDELNSLLQGQGTLLTQEYLLARLKYPNASSILEYRVYGRRQLDRFLKDTEYHVRNFRPGSPCLYQDGSLCWNYNAGQMFKIINSSTLIFFGGSILIISLVIWLLLNKIRQQRNEEERKRLALQVLTHEFRTPIASMLLQMEMIQKYIDTVDPEFQESLLRLSSDVYRLQRLTETSRNYLKIRNNNKLIDFRPACIPSLNGFTEHLLDHFPEVEFEPLEHDMDVCMDTYWMSIIVQNLINNAYAHGVPPVKLALQCDGSCLSFVVEDQGDGTNLSLDEMTSEFVKGPKSEGSGLGMNIVNKVIKEMGGELVFHTNPTRFIVKFKLKKVKNKEGDNGQNHVG